MTKNRVLARALGAGVGGALFGTVGEDTAALSADGVTALLAGLGGGRTTARGVLAHFCFWDLRGLEKRRNEKKLVDRKSVNREITGFF